MNYFSYLPTNDVRKSLLLDEDLDKVTNLILMKIKRMAICFQIQTFIFLWWKAFSFFFAGVNSQEQMLFQVFQGVVTNL